MPSTSRTGLAVLAAVACGCATGRFDAARPVTGKPVLHVHSYEQGGPPIPPGQIAEALSANPAFAPALEGYSAKAIGGSVLVAGGCLVGAGILFADTLKQNSDVQAGRLNSDAGDKHAPLAIGVMVGGVVAGSVLHALADRQLLQAVELHNASLRPASPATPPGPASPASPATSAGPPTSADSGGAAGATSLSPYLGAAPGPGGRLAWCAGLLGRF